ncbi:Uma2 family endonuclease [Streptomyces sp. NPDC002928]|uniref:Uma2 family endonuclease n=1 Tax=Streptomyces sp. NPDC002928 TaxID=3154440 RepID=UPI0033B11298
MTAESLPTWAFPPPGGFTADDLDRIPELPPHTELIDGSLVFVTPQSSFHAAVLFVLEHALYTQTPEGLLVRREMTVTLGPRNRPEPDLTVIRAEASDPHDGQETGYTAADALLVVEVVSPESEDRDRERKPQLYARAGIPHFWRVERAEKRRPTVYVYELDNANHVYVPTGIHHERLELKVPFPIDIDLTAVDRY